MKSKYMNRNMKKVRRLYSKRYFGVNWKPKKPKNDIFSIDK